MCLSPPMQLYFIQEIEEPLIDDSEYDKKLPRGNFFLFYLYDSNFIVS